MFKQILVAALVLTLGIYLLGSSPAQNAAGTDVDSWRHLALSSEDEDDPQLAPRINQLGRDGWQLVDVANFVSGGETVKTVFYFKKPGQ